MSLGSTIDQCLAKETGVFLLGTKETSSSVVHMFSFCLLLAEKMSFFFALVWAVRRLTNKDGAKGLLPLSVGGRLELDLRLDSAIEYSLPRTEPDSS